MSAKIEVTCPKCLGSKYFAPFAHIAGGACFTCSGNGTILVYPNSSGATDTIPTKSTRREKTIELDTLGMVTIMRWGTGFRAALAYADAYFDVIAGQISIYAVTDGFRHKDRMAAELQRALRA